MSENTGKAMWEAPVSVHCLPHQSVNSSFPSFLHNPPNMRSSSSCKELHVRLLWMWRAERFTQTSLKQSHSHNHSFWISRPHFTSDTVCRGSIRAFLICPEILLLLFYSICSFNPTSFAKGVNPFFRIYASANKSSNLSFFLTEMNGPLKVRPFK